MSQTKLLAKFDKKVLKEGFEIIAGVDEAGRGPLAGPVVAAACILPNGFKIDGIDDSKKLTSELRFSLYEKIISYPGIHYSVGIISSQEIDRINIYQATIQAMLTAMSGLTVSPTLFLVDGMKLPHDSVPCRQVIGGDALSLSIATSSIIAKVHRDKMMLEYHEQWAEYGFAKHKGYATPEHLAAIEVHGACPIHRLSFSPFKPKV